VEKGKVKACKNSGRKNAGFLLDVPHGIELSATGLNVTVKLSYEDWFKLGKTLQIVHRSVLFWIGDWLLFGEQNWGEKFSQAIDATGYSVETLRNAHWVSSRVESVRRNNALTWSHHQQIASLEPCEQDKFLHAAAQNGWGVRELRAAVRLLREPEKKPDWQEPSDPPEVVSDDIEYEETGEQIIVERSNLEADFRHLLALTKAYRLAEKGDSARGIDPDPATAIRLATALDFFIANHGRVAARNRHGTFTQERRVMNDEIESRKTTKLHGAHHQKGSRTER
jgi:hypothetical protein